VTPRRDDEVLAVGRAQDRVEPLVAVARGQSQLAVREHTVHREPVAVEVVARRVEDEEVDAGDRTWLELVGPVGELERVVERVEVGADRNRSSLRVVRAVWPESR